VRHVIALVLMTFVACKGGAPSKGSAGRVGDIVTLSDSEWVVIEATDEGTSLRSNSSMTDETKDARGRFIQVHYKVVSRAGREQPVLRHPKIVDDAGHEFRSIDMERFYVPPESKTIALEPLQPGLPAEFWTVIDVPSDAKGLKFQVEGLGMGVEKKKIDLDL
jgi:hypothetical protein